MQEEQKDSSLVHCHSPVASTLHVSC